MMAAETSSWTLGQLKKRYTDARTLYQSHNDIESIEAKQLRHEWKTGKSQYKKTKTKHHSAAVKIQAHVRGQKHRICFINASRRREELNMINQLGLQRLKEEKSFVVKSKSKPTIDDMGRKLQRDLMSSPHSSTSTRDARSHQHQQQHQHKRPRQRPRQRPNTNTNTKKHERIPSSRQDSTWLVFSGTSSRVQQITSGEHRRILLLNQQAVEAMSENHFNVAEKIFIVISNLLGSRTDVDDGQIFLSLKINLLNNRACLSRKQKRLQASTEFLTEALALARKLTTTEQRSAEILPVLCNLACVASLRNRHLEAVSFAARSVLIIMAMEEREKKSEDSTAETTEDTTENSVVPGTTHVPEEQRIVCLFNLAAEMEHLGGSTKSMVGNVYHYAYEKALVNLGKTHKLTQQMEKATKVHAKTTPIFGFNMAKLTASIMKMYGTRPLRKKQQRQKKMKGRRQHRRSPAKSMANLHQRYNASYTKQALHQSPRRPTKRPSSAGRYRPRSNHCQQRQQRPSSAASSGRRGEDITNQVLSPLRSDHIKKRPASPALQARSAHLAIPAHPAQRPISAPSRRRCKVNARKVPNHGQNSTPFRTGTTTPRYYSVQESYKHPIRPAPKPRIEAKELTLEQKKQMRQASMRVHRHIHKENLVAAASEWPPPWMRPNFRKLLENCPNPTQYIEDIDIPPSVERPTLGSVFISDFAINGWEARAQRKQRKVNHCPRKKKIQKKDAGPVLRNDLTADMLLANQDVLARVMKDIQMKIRAERSALFLVDRNTNELICGHVPETVHDPGHPEFRIPLTAGIVGYVCSTGGILNLADAYTYPLFSPATDKATGFRTKGILAIPILGHGSVCGVVEFINRKEEEDGTTFFTTSDMNTVREMLGAVITNKILPLPVNMISNSMDPVKLKHLYGDQFTPPLYLLIDTTRSKNG